MVVRVPKIHFSSLDTMSVMVDTDNEKEWIDVQPSAGSLFVLIEPLRNPKDTEMEAADVMDCLHARWRKTSDCRCNLGIHSNRSATTSQHTNLELGAGKVAAR